MAVISSNTFHGLLPGQPARNQTPTCRFTSLSGRTKAPMHIQACPSQCWLHSCSICPRIPHKSAPPHLLITLQVLGTDDSILKKFYDTMQGSGKFAIFFHLQDQSPVIFINSRLVISHSSLLFFANKEPQYTSTADLSNYKHMLHTSLGHIVKSVVLLKKIVDVG